jgi:hypothetical protein
MPSCLCFCFCFCFLIFAFLLFTFPFPDSGVSATLFVCLFSPLPRNHMLIRCIQLDLMYARTTTDCLVFSYPMTLMTPQIQVLKSADWVCRDDRASKVCCK